MKKTFYSNGKLLITGEYLVLDGAQAFALPTKKGQNLIVEEGKKEQIYWKSLDFDGTIWFEDSLSFEEIKTGKTENTSSVKNTLIEILHEGYKMNPNFLNTEKGYSVRTELTFPRNWGLGTSSTLINNIGQWLQIDAFTLLKNSFGGSGYDIACAQNNSPIVFEIKAGQPTVEPIEFHPEFTKDLYFVYLNKKQNSKAAIEAYQRNKKTNLAEIIIATNNLTKAAYQAKTLADFETVLREHENNLSAMLETPTVQKQLFPDFDGTIKSLGAWGGDFLLAASTTNPTAYFNAKGFETAIPFEEMILDQQ
ncbi:GYDIA family GHMP kinase [Flavobacterium sp. GNP001]